MPGRKPEQSDPMMSRALALAAALLAAPTPPPGAGPAAQPGSGTAQFAARHEARAIPLDVVGEGLAFVQGQVQGTRVWLLLDTGSPSVLSRKLADKLGLPGEDAAASGAPDQVPIRRLRDVAVDLPGVRILQPAVSSLDLDRLETLLGHRLDGILGTPFFESAVVEIDFAGRTLALSDPAAPRAPEKGATVALTREGGLPYATAKVALSSAPPLEGSFLLDTGADSAAVLSSPFVDRHRLLASPSASKARPDDGTAAAGGSFEAVLRAQSIVLGPFVLTKPVVRLSRSTKGLLADSRHAGLVGAAVLARFRVTFDYGRGRVVLQRNARFAEPFGYDASGLSLAAQSSDLATFEIRRVAPASPAAETGLRTGDVVLSVDGKPARDVGLGALRRMLQQSGATYTLSVFRDGQIRKFTLTCRSQL